LAWTTPKTWSAGETLTAANFNTHIRDNFNADWHLIARKTADQSVTSSTVLVDDTHLQLTVATNEVWSLQFRVLMNAAAAGDFRWTYSFPSGNIYEHLAATNAAGTFIDIPNTHSVSDDNTQNLNGLAAANLWVWDVLYVVGGSGGTLKLRWCQQTSSGTATTLVTNSHLMGMKLA